MSNEQLITHGEFYEHLRLISTRRLKQSQVDAGNALFKLTKVDAVGQLLNHPNIKQDTIYPPNDFTTEEIDLSKVFDRLRLINGGFLTQNDVNLANAVMSSADGKGAELLVDLLNIKGQTYLTEEKLLKIYPKADIRFVDAINKWGPLYDIDTKERMAMFLAQALHETDGFNKLRENLNYSAARYYEVFKSRVKSLAEAIRIVNAGQRSIANNVYNGRYGNRIGSDDGYNFRGGGLFHLTFRDNYIWVGNAINVDLVNLPSLITDPEVAVKSGMFYFSARGCNELADQRNDKAVSKIVNGGYNGLKERRRLYNRAMQVL